MSGWAIAAVIVGVWLGVWTGAYWRYRRRHRSLDTPVSDQWRAEHDYHRGGDGK